MRGTTFATRACVAQRGVGSAVGMADDLKVAEILLVGTDAQGDQLALVRLSNGQCALTRNGVPLPGRHWPDFRDCAMELLRMLGLLDPCA